MRSHLIAPVLALIVGSTAAARANLVIDSFASGAVTVSATEYGSTDGIELQNNLPTAETVGGTRYIRVQSIGDDQDLTPATATIDTADQSLRFDSSPSTFGYLTLTYGSESPLAADLTADGGNRFAIDFSEVDEFSRGLINLRVMSGNGTLDTVSFGQEFFAISNSGSSAGRVSVPFAEFNGLDFTDIASVTLDFGRIEAGQGFTIDRIAVVPEPTTSMLILAMAATCLYRHR